MLSKINYYLKTPIVFVADDSSELVTLQIIFKVGSVHESLDQSGISHLIEHMVFKGSQKYSAKEISYGVEHCGGDINAYTTKEYTAFYINGYHKHLATFIDILFDICFFPDFNEREFEKEKDVVINEILSLNDNPEEYLSEYLESRIYEAHTLGRPITGTVSSVEQMKIEQLKEFHSEYYHLNNCIIGISGKFDESILIQKLDGMKIENNKHVGSKESLINFNNIKVLKKFPVEQAYMIKAYPACNLADNDRFAYYAFSYMLASSMSSRLFQKIREEKALCYSIDSEVSLFHGTGYFAIYIDFLPKNIDKIRDILAGEIKELLTNGFIIRELELAKNLLKFNLLSVYESCGSMLSAEMYHILYYGCLMNKSGLLTCVDSISLDQVNHVSKNIFSGKEAECILFPLK